MKDEKEGEIFMLEYLFYMPNRMIIGAFIAIQ